MTLTPFPELFRRYFGVLESLGIRYFAYGGVAVGVWGDPRETQDVDAVAMVGEDGPGSLLATLGTAGFAIRPEAPTTLPIDGWLRATYGGRFADLALGRTPFDESAMQRRVRVRIFDTDVWVASPEDLILYKLIAYRRKDLADAEAVLTRQQHAIDLPYLRSWAGEIARHSGKFEVPGTLETLLAELEGRK